MIRVWEDEQLTSLEISRRFNVSESLVKKLIAQKKELGHVCSLHDHVGRKPKLGLKDQERLRQLVEKEPGISLHVMKERLRLSCSITSIHRALRRMGVFFRNGRYVTANKKAFLLPFTIR
ncbi:MAG: hypothetical protein LBE15_03030 [Burkholderiales bacterium]|jgi:transposase|nr:hypothetical protein [Burkholderiales bacterium]